MCLEPLTGIGYFHLLTIPTLFSFSLEWLQASLPSDFIPRDRGTANYRWPNRSRLIQTSRPASPTLRATGPHKAGLYTWLGGRSPVCRRSRPGDPWALLVPELVTDWYRHSGSYGLFSSFPTEAVTLIPPLVSNLQMAVPSLSRRWPPLGNCTLGIWALKGLLWYATTQSSYHPSNFSTELSSAIKVLKRPK